MIWAMLGVISVDQIWIQVSKPNPTGLHGVRHLMNMTIGVYMKLDLALDPTCGS
jgi:hypothetical protein